MPATSSQLWRLPSRWRELLPARRCEQLPRMRWKAAAGLQCMNELSSVQQHVPMSTTGARQRVDVGLTHVSTCGSAAVQEEPCPPVGADSCHVGWSWYWHAGSRILQGTIRAIQPAAAVAVWAPHGVVVCTHVSWQDVALACDTSSVYILLLL
jgi:hypothetical protein